VARAAVEVAQAHITMEQAVTMMATATVMENVRSNNQPAVTVDMPSLTIGLFSAPPPPPHTR